MFKDTDLSDTTLLDTGEHEVVHANARIDEDGNVRNVDNPYEEGIYCAVIGLDLSDNPYSSEEEFSRRLWLRGYSYVLAKRRGEVS